jgi:hypothetical protein
MDLPKYCLWKCNIHIFAFEFSLAIGDVLGSHPEVDEATAGDWQVEKVSRYSSFSYPPPIICIFLKSENFFLFQIFNPSPQCFKAKTKLTASG